MEYLYIVIALSLLGLGTVMKWKARKDFRISQRAKLERFKNMVDKGTIK